MGNRLEELETKRIEVLEAIKPICEAFNFEYDYLVKTDGRQETLILNGQKIGCSFICYINKLFTTKPPAPHNV